MDISNLAGKLVVITGGSSGIGFCIAEQLARLGADILLVARNQQKLDQSVECLIRKYNGRFEGISVDVSKAEEVELLVRHIRVTWGCADIIINSAGIVSAGKLHETPIEEWDRLYAINVRGLVLVLQALIPDMIAAHVHDSEQRHIVNIASAAAYSGAGGMSAYSATKAAVVALGDSLRAELVHQHIGVSTIAPGFVKTPIAETVQLFGSMNSPEGKQAVSKMFSKVSLLPEHVADKTLNAIGKNKPLVNIGFEARSAHFLKRLSPSLLARVVSARIHT
jgi:short-subunit dehydrogenase